MKSEKVLIIYSFLACLFLMAVGIYSARTTDQLLTSFIYLPLVFFFGTRIFYSLYRPNGNLKSKKALALQTSNADNLQADPETKGVADKDKRLFLQLIGTTGISLLIMALFSRQARNSLLGGGDQPTPEIVSLKNIAGETVNPAEKTPTEGYSITDIDDQNPTAYYAFVNNNGAWYIIQDSSGTFRYAKGTNNYAASWDVRDRLRYDYYNNVFNS